MFPNKRWRDDMLMRQDCPAGTKVVFGRRNGEQSLARVVKANPKKAQVVLLERRGNGRGSEIGSPWTVPYSMLRKATEAEIKAGYAVGSGREDHSKDGERGMLPPIVQEKLEYNIFQPSEEVHLMLAILDCYSGLSPENLACDGEASQSHIRSESIRLNRILRGCFHALGKQVDETSAYEWFDSYQKAQKARQKAS